MTHDTDLDERDALYLRRAIELSRVARDRGNRPFGAVIVAPDGTVLAEAFNTTGESGDCTGHAETNAVRLVSPVRSREALAQATLYSSAEPCVMCAGAIAWSHIGRVVFGIGAARVRQYRRVRDEWRDPEMGCREVFAVSPRPIACIGPVLEDEAAAPHDGAWTA